MPLLKACYWPTTYWAKDYWPTYYWSGMPSYGQADVSKGNIIVFTQRYWNEMKRRSPIPGILPRQRWVRYKP